MAASVAQKIHAQGWSVWEWRPEGQAPVGIASAIYALTTSKPWVLIPLNAFLHATAALILFKIALIFIPDWRKAIFCIIPFVCYPSAASWYAQIHKDGYSILGLLMILYGWLIVDGNIFIRREYAKLSKGFPMIIFGTFLIWSVRPYLRTCVNLMTYLFIVIVFSFLVFMLCKKHLKIKIFSLSIFSFIILICLLSPEKIFRVYARNNETINVITNDSVKISQNKGAFIEAISIVTIKNDMNSNVIKIREARARFIEADYAAGAKSAIDNDINFNSLSDVIVYIPRALQIAFLSPFPAEWFKQGSFTANTLMRRISVIETLGVYFSLMFLPFAAFFWRKRIEFWSIIIFCSGLLLIHGLVITNVGTLYRMRYGLLMPIVALGIAGFIKLLEIKAK
jgi:hypothetical protein